MRDGWEIKKLKDISTISYGYTAKASWNNDGPKFLRITDIQDGAVNWNNVPTACISKGDFKKYKLQHGDIVFARTGATTGKSYLISDPHNAVAASYLIRLRLCDDCVTSEYVSYYFQTARYWQSIADGTSGSAQGGVNASKLSALMLPIPPLPEQKRIVVILDEAFAGIEKAMANTKKNLANAKELFDSYLFSIFTACAKNWKTRELGQVCNIVGGGTPSKNNSAFYDGDIPWATVRDMRKPILSRTEFCITQEAVQSSSTNIIPADNVIIATRVGLGKVCLINQDTAINQDLRGIIPKSKELDVNYLFRWLQSVSRKIEDEGTGATVKGVKLPFIKSLSIPLPPLSEQVIIVEQLNELDHGTQRLQSIYQQKLTALAELKQALLQKAFFGELTADEQLLPAEVAA